MRGECTAHRCGISGAVLCTVLAVLVPSCSSNPPELIRTKYQINYFFDQTRKTKYEKLSVFLQVDDEDGIDDISELRVTHESSGLFWTFTPDTWQIERRNDENWIGSNGIVMQGSEQFPAGTYRVLITDAAGYTKESTFGLTELERKPDAVNYPTLSFTESSVTIRSEAPVTAFFYSGLDRYLYNRPLAPGTVSLTSLGREGEARPDSLYLYLFNQEDGYGVLSGPYKIP